MPFNLYISTAGRLRGSVVISAANPVAIPIREFALGNIIDTNIFLVDGAGGYDAASGAAGYTVKVGIGFPRAGAAWTETTWTAITSPHAGWNGNISTNTQAIADLFDSEDSNPIEPTLEITITDPEGRPVCELLIPIKIWKRVIDPGDLVEPPAPANAFGYYVIPDQADTGSVTGLNLAAVPRMIGVLGVSAPAGGLTISWSVVTGTITTDGFSFRLTGATDQATYWLQYQLIY